MILSIRIHRSDSFRALQVHGSSMLKPCRNMIQPSKSSRSSKYIQITSKLLYHCCIQAIPYWYNVSPGHWRCPALQVSRHLPAADSSCLQSGCDERALRPRRLCPKWLRGFPRSDLRKVWPSSRSLDHLDRGVPRSNSEVGRWCHCNLRSNRREMVRSHREGVLHDLHVISCNFTSIHICAIGCRCSFPLNQFF